MPELWVNDAAVARKLKQLWVNDAGVARQLLEVWVNDGAVARKIHAPVVLVDTLNYQLQFAGTAQSQISMTSGGAVTGNGVLTPLSYAWLNGGGGASYDVFATLLTGTLDLGTTGSWLNLGTTRNWRVDRSALGVKTATMGMQIRDAGTLAVVAAATFTITAERQ